MLEQDKNLGADAQQVLNNRAYKESIRRMTELLEAKALSCDPDNKEQTQRVILAKQILVGIQRELAKLVEFGQVADIQLSELDKRRKSVFRR